MRASWRARSARRLPAGLGRPDARRHLVPPPGRGLRRAGARPGRGGADLIIIETAQDILEVKAAIFGARAAFNAAGRPVPIQASVRPAAGRQDALGRTSRPSHHAYRPRRRRDRAQLLDRSRGHARRDPVPRRELAAARPLHPERGPAAAGAGRGDDLPETPEQISSVLGEFVERHNVGVVGGCCGTTPDHIRALAERVAGRMPASAGRARRSWSAR